jgi:geranylgeranyl transferase type-1 subunit beta
MTYCAFIICSLLDDWSCIDLPRALSYIQRCRVRVLPSSLLPTSLPTDHRVFFSFTFRTNVDAERPRPRYQTYEGGYGQTPRGESLGGPTYCALAALYLVPADHACAPQPRLERAEWHATVRWLLHTQAQTCGGLAGRTNKLADACYAFWCGAALAVRYHLSLSFVVL